MKKVLITTNIPSPYRVDFFNELGKHVDLTVCFEKPFSSERDELWKKQSITSFQAVFLKGFNVSVDTAFSFGIIKHILDKTNQNILILNPLTPTGLLAIFVLRIFKKEFMVETDGGFYNENEKIKNLIRSFAYTGAKICFSTSKIHDNYYQKLGVKPERIVRYPFTSIYEKNILKKPLTHKEKLKIRKELGIEEEKIILGVGQFIYRKGYDLLLSQADELDDTYGIYLIGGTDISIYENILKNLKFKNIHFLPFMNKQQLWKYYQAADVFVHPAREDIWGLVINEAMANGLPIITTHKTLASLELSVDDNITRIVNSDFIKACRNMINFRENTSSSLDHSLLVIDYYTFEKMVDLHINYFF